MLNRLITDRGPGLPVVLLLVGCLFANCADAWWNPTWQSRLQLTFDNSAQAQNLDDFPVLVVLTPARIDYSNTEPGGADLRFVDANDTALLKHEVESWVPGGTSYVWVRVPRIDGSSSSDSIFLYYQKPGAPDVQDAAGVWAPDHLAVWHLDDDPTGAAPVLDSTVNLKHGTGSGSMNATNIVAGYVGFGTDFDGVSDYVRVPSGAGDVLEVNGNDLTLEAWVRRNADTPGNNWMAVFGRQFGSGSVDSYTQALKFDDPSDMFGVFGADAASSGTGGIPNLTWRYVAAVHDIANTTLYLDGAQVAQSASSGAVISDPNDVTIGAMENDGTAIPTEWFVGTIDEVRVSAVPRSADWIAAQHKSMADTFVNYAASGSITGVVFEDVNYGGGAGRGLAASSGVPLGGVTMELYDGSGNLISSTVTAAGTGQYSFGSLADGNYQVRVVNQTVDSSRAGATGAEWPVQTFRTDASGGAASAVTDHVGGEIPGEVDAGVNGGASTLAALSAPAGVEVQSLTPVSVAGSLSAGIDFGFSFNLIVNTNDAGQGSLRQFKDNSNNLANAGLAQDGHPAGIDNAIFMLADGSARPGLNAGYASQFSGGIATIRPATLILAFLAPVVLDASRQPGFAGTPIIELDGSVSSGADGVTFDGGGSTLRGWIINRFAANGVYVSGAGDNRFYGNYIGTDAAGTGPAANDANGISIAGQPGNIVGGAAAGEPNLVGGNAGNGVSIIGAGATGNSVIGNFIGVNAAGTAIPNTMNGVRIRESDNNTVGGTALNEANTIAHNLKHGVLLYNNGAAAPTGNLITGNTIHDNAFRGIDLSAVISIDGDGPTANNGAKNAGLPNFEMDTPVLVSAVINGADLTVSGYVGSAPGQPLFANSRVEFFAADSDGADIYGEGERYLGFLTADASGNFAGTLTVAGINDGDQLTATATDTSNNTSEFAANFSVTEARIIVKKAFQLDGTPIADVSTLPVGLPFRFLLYVDNPQGQLLDTALRDVLDPLFDYQAGTMKIDNTLVSTVVCPGGVCDESAIFSQVDSAGTPLGDGDAVTAPVDADTGSYTSAARAIDLGHNSNGNNAQLDLAANSVLAAVFTVRIQ